MDIIGLLFPKKCINCGKDEKYLCEECLAKVKLVNAICAYCQKPSMDGMTHFACQKKTRMDGFISFWDYSGVIRKAILGLKYKFAKELSGEISSLVVRNLISGYKFLDSKWILVPIPIHEAREKWRGFNQCVLMGAQIAEKMSWKFRFDVLLKTKKTTPQADLKGKERIGNVVGVFKLNPTYKLKNTHIILFDDVFTTGSTLKEAAKVLKRRGAKSVWGLCLAR